MKIILCLVVSIFFIVSPAYADEASHRETALEYLRVSGVKETYNIMFEDNMAPVQEQYRNATRAFYAKYLSWEDVKNDYAQVLVDNFTERELKEVIAFHETPVGKKLTAFSPTFMLKVQKMSEQRIVPHKAELVAAIEAIKKKQKDEKSKDLNTHEK